MTKTPVFYIMYPILRLSLLLLLLHHYLSIYFYIHQSTPFSSMILLYMVLSYIEDYYYYYYIYIKYIFFFFLLSLFCFLFIILQVKATHIINRFHGMVCVHVAHAHVTLLQLSRFLGDKMSTKHWQRLAGFLLCIFIAVDLERIVEAAEWTCTNSSTNSGTGGQGGQGGQGGNR